MTVATDGQNVYFAHWRDKYAPDDVPYGLLDSYTVDGRFRWSRRPYFSADGSDPDYPVAVDASGPSVLVIENDLARDDDVLVAVAPDDGDTLWTEPLPAGFGSTSAALGSAGLYLGGASADSLGADSAGRLDAVVARAVTFQPDARARFLHSDTLVGDDRYGRPHQRLVVAVEGVKPRTVVVSAQNDGEVAQRLRVTGCGRHGGYAFRYLGPSGNDVTRDVTGRGYRTASLAPGDEVGLRVVIKPVRRTTGAATCRATVTSARGDEDRFVLAVRRP